MGLNPTYLRSDYTIHPLFCEMREYNIIVLLDCCVIFLILHQ